MESDAGSGERSRLPRAAKQGAISALSGSNAHSQQSQQISHEVDSPMQRGGDSTMDDVSTVGSDGDGESTIGRGRKRKSSFGYAEPAVRKRFKIHGFQTDKYYDR